MHTPAQPQHHWLKNLLGDWSIETECVMGPDQPPMKLKGRESVRMLGDLWAVCEGGGPMHDGGQMSFIMTLGFDPARGKFVGTWIGSPMSHMFVYEGSLDAAERTLTLDTTGPSFTDPSRTERYQDIITIVSPTQRTLTSRTPGPDGSWVQFMHAVLTRR